MVASGVLIFGTGLTGVAHAVPETPVAYPAGSSATRVQGQGFDTCTAPSLDAMKAWWGTSPYTVANIYFGGLNRGCAQPNLTKAWVAATHRMGWRLLPTYFGYQPYCKFGESKPHRYTADTATSRGQSDGADAVAQAKALGILPGSALYADVEHYDRTKSSCRLAVRRYVSAWTKKLHSAGFLAGVYVHQDSGVRDLADTYNSTSFARPDAVWMARFDGNPSLTGWPTAPDSYWGHWQRLKQYKGDHNETWGGVTLNIDSDSVKGPLATIARSYWVTSDSPLSARKGPYTTSPVVRSYAPGAKLPVMCQGNGSKVGTTTVWDRLSTGAWVTDYYVSTKSNTGFAKALPRCAYPGQVSSSTPLNVRTGPGTSYPKSGSPLPRGALAYVACQKQGSKVGTTSVWDRLTDGRWVTDYHVTNQSNTTWSAPVPRCP